MIKKSFPIIILSIFFVIISFFVVFPNKSEYENVMTLQVLSENEKQEITPWYDDGTIYFFLPSYAELDNSKLVFDTLNKVSIDGNSVSSGVNVGDITLEESHKITIGNKHYKLVLHKSENVAAIYINTATGSMDEIYDDIDHEEPISIKIYDETGTVNYSANDSYLKGRGNSTWDYKDKKPFSLKLSSASEILGMDASIRWALLANAYDVTNMRDKIVKDFAGNLDLAYSPKEEYADLYLNGEYNGLYVISEKVEVAENRLELPEDSVLCTFEFSQRWNLLENPVATDEGQVIEVKYPQVCSESKLNEISSYIQQMENAIMDENGNIAEIIDIDSWARMYLIEEVFEDVDVGIASSYFYWSEADGKIYSGPVWDFDRSMGSDIANCNPETFFAKREWRSLGYQVPYYDALLKHEDFRERVIEIYYDEFAPLMEELVDDKVEELGLKINKASDMNYVRWSTSYAISQKNVNNIAYTYADLKDYLEKRLVFLNSAMMDIYDYKMVHIGYNADYFDYVFSVKAGEVLELPNLENMGITNLEGFVDNETGESFDITQPITENVELRTIMKTDSNAISKILQYKTKLMYLGTILFMVLILFGFVLIDIRRGKRGGRVSA
jgi:hypothetical protein